MKATREEGHFLNEKQKEVKEKIINGLLDVLFDNISRNRDIFNNIRAIIDVTTLVLIMFNRDVLHHIFTVFNLEHARKDIMKDLFQTIEDEVNKKIKLGMM